MTDAPLVEPSLGQTVPKHTHGGLFLEWVLILMIISILTIILTTHIVTLRQRLDDQEAAICAWAQAQTPVATVQGEAKRVWPVLKECLGK